MKKQVIGVIPARFASTRFPGKPLALIRGKPMILHVLERALRAKALSQVLVATDHNEIKRAVESAGGRAIMTDPHLPSGTDRINAAVKGLEGEIIVNIQGDEPLLHPEMLDLLVSPLLHDNSVLMSTLSGPISKDEVENPNVVKVIANQKGDAIYFSRFPIPYSRSKAEAPFICQKHLGLYAYHRTFLETFCAAPMSDLEKSESLEQLRALSLGAQIRVMQTVHTSVGVDTPEDLAKIEKWLGETK